VNREPRLLATCWTTAGAASPSGPLTRSPFTVADRIAAAAADGWSGFGLVHADLVEFRRTRPLGELRRLLDDHGVEHLELELIEDWWTDGERRTASDRVRRDVFDAAEAAGAATVKVGPDTSAPADPDRLAESFATLAAEAAEHGTRVALEFLPFAGTLRDLRAGIDLVTRVGHPAGGLCLDVWHVARPGTDYALIAESLPGEHLFAVELDDAAAEPVGTLFEDTVQRRLLPGQGSFDVPAFIAAVRATGFDGPWGVEMLSDRHRGLPLPQALREAREAALACFAEADHRAA
jgi:sugar phosphate isomerase/epimerase